MVVGQSRLPLVSLGSSHFWRIVAFPPSPGAPTGILGFETLPESQPSGQPYWVWDGLPTTLVHVEGNLEEKKPLMDSCVGLPSKAFPSGVETCRGLSLEKPLKKTKRIKSIFVHWKDEMHTNYFC